MWCVVSCNLAISLLHMLVSHRCIDKSFCVFIRREGWQSRDLIMDSGFAANGIALWRLAPAVLVFLLLVSCMYFFKSQLTVRLWRLPYTLCWIINPSRIYIGTIWCCFIVFRAAIWQTRQQGCASAVQSPRGEMAGTLPHPGLLSSGSVFWFWLPPLSIWEICSFCLDNLGIFPVHNMFFPLTVISGCWFQIFLFSSLFSCTGQCSRCFLFTFLQVLFFPYSTCCVSDCKIGLAFDSVYCLSVY